MIDWKETIDSIGFIAGTVCSLVVLIVVPVCTVYEVAGRYTCSNYEKITGNESQWVTLDECYVKHNDEWVRYSAYEKMIIARDTNGRLL